MKYIHEIDYENLWNKLGNKIDELIENGKWDIDTGTCNDDSKIQCYKEIKTIMNDIYKRKG